MHYLTNLDVLILSCVKLKQKLQFYLSFTKPVRNTRTLRITFSKISSIKGIILFTSLLSHFVKYPGSFTGGNGLSEHSGAWWDSLNISVNYEWGAAYVLERTALWSPGSDGQGEGGEGLPLCRLVHVLAVDLGKMRGHQVSPPAATLKWRQ